VLPQGVAAPEDKEGQAPGVHPQAQAKPTPAPPPKARPMARAVGGTYELEEQPVEPPRTQRTPAPVTPSAEYEDRPRGLTVPAWALIGGGVGVALLSVLAVWGAGAIGMFRGRAAVGEAPVASVPARKAEATQAAPAGAPSTAPLTAPAPETTDSAVQAAPGSVSVADALQILDEPTLAPGTETAPVPGTAPGRAAVFVAAPTGSGPAPAPDPAPAVESDVAAKARAGAAAVAARDDGAGKTLTTAEIVAESESSVALIKGKESSGTGFLVGPGLLATNSHVIDDEFMADLEVRFVSADESHKTPLKAELLYEDPERDLAFLAVNSDLKPLRVAKTYAFRKGEDITVIGNPGMGEGKVLENAISRGVMSTKTQIDNKNYYQLGIAINPGNSGGPVFDSSGRVIGVATLKSSKQEAMGFSIPIEDFQGALIKLTKQSTAELDGCRSRHRLRVAVKGLSGGGALLCLVIDLRRAGVQTNSPAVKEILGKLEPVAAEIDKDVFPTLTDEAPLIRKDSLIAPTVRNMVGEMTDNFTRIRSAYSTHRGVDDKQLRTWKQNHRRLITALSAALKIEFPKEMMVAFDDHAPTQPTIITMAPSNLGSYGFRLRQRSLSGSPRTPGGLPRPPSLRDRMGRGIGSR